MFGTSGLRGRVGEAVTAAVALDVGRAVGSETTRVVVGRDARETGETLCDAVAAGLCETGTDVVDVGRASTPTVARAIAARDADAGIVVTASHNPAPDNGLKLWTPSGQAFSPARQETIATRIEQSQFTLAEWDEHGTRECWRGATDAHRRALVDAGRRAAAGVGSGFGSGSGSGSGSKPQPESTSTPLSNLSVVVDIGNGTGGVTADALRALGAHVETLNARPDGRFPARPSEPTADTCDSLASTVAALDADLGVAHDGDADRMMAVTDEGAFVPGDQLLALFGRETASAGDRVAAPVDTSLAVADALESDGIELVYTPVGDVHVAARAAEAAVRFGGEPSGAWVFPDETLCPDGPLAAVRLAVLAAATPLSTRLKRIDRYPIRRESIETTAKTAVMESVRSLVTEQFEDVSTLDGVRAATDAGWVLIRASGTQPLVRVTAEARTTEPAERLRAEALDIVERAIRLSDQG